MEFRKIITEAIVDTICHISFEILERVTTQQEGIEEILYPYFNKEIIQRLDLKQIRGIGYGRLDNIGDEKIDCLIITIDEKK